VYYYTIKKEITYKIKIKHNAGLLYILSLIFIKIPRAAIFKNLYNMAKLYNNKNKNKKKILILLYKILLINIIGFPL
jgi:hypothetical protein